MEEKEYDVVVLEDGLEYAEINKMKLNGKTYIFLTNLKNDDDFCIRRLIKKDNKEFFEGLSSKEEFDEVLREFYRSNFN